VSFKFKLVNKSKTFKPSHIRELPIFRRDEAEYAMFYAPGCLVVVNIANADRFEDELGSPDVVERTKMTSTPTSSSIPDEKYLQSMYWRGKLWHHAKKAAMQSLNLHTEHFRPESLTLFMNNECNLRCVYCHADHLRKAESRLELEAIHMAAEYVAMNCRKKGIPFLAVFHGGGEPVLHRSQVDQAMVLLKKIASMHGTHLSTYVATNGVMSEEKAYWLSRRFDLIGLSCDGPPEVQDFQRPLWGDRPTSHVLEQTGHILRNEGCRIHIRTTITDKTIHRQEEIAEYICNQFSPEEIHFEPVYVGGRRNPRLLIGQANKFVTGFLKAQEISERHNIPLTSSGSRLGSIHGPYCNVFRSVLNLVPGGLATACFKISVADQVIKKGAKIGQLNRKTGQFDLDHPHIQILRKKLDFFLSQCTDCFNRYHCARECPDLCPLNNDFSHDGASMNPGFRCRVQQAIAYANLQKIAKRLWSSIRIRENGNGETCCVTGQTIECRYENPVGLGRDPSLAG
jgi:uncharacterized protein